MYKRTILYYKDSTFVRIIKYMFHLHIGIRESISIQADIEDEVVQYFQSPMCMLAPERD